jgi:flagellar assembly protein FliH
MPQMPTINLMQPIAAAFVVDPEQLRVAGGGWQMEPPAPNLQSEIRDSPLDDLQKELQQQKDTLAQLVETVNGVATGLSRSYEQMLASNHGEIAKLAVEIARKILMYKAGKGDYEIQAIVEEALKQAPTHQNVVVRLHPEDLPHCQQLQQENPQSPLAELEFAADWSIGRGECLVETPKGIVQSFIEERLERISGALQKVQ